jgi:hypothetical protein
MDEEKNSGILFLQFSGNNTLCIVPLGDIESSILFFSIHSCMAIYVNIVCADSCILFFDAVVIFIYHSFMSV